MFKLVLQELEGNDLMKILFYWTGQEKKLPVSTSQQLQITVTDRNLGMLESRTCAFHLYIPKVSHESEMRTVIQVTLDVPRISFSSIFVIVDSPLFWRLCRHQCHQRATYSRAGCRSYWTFPYSLQSPSSVKKRLHISRCVEVHHAPHVLPVNTTTTAIRHHTISSLPTSLLGFVLAGHPRSARNAAASLACFGVSQKTRTRTNPALAPSRTSGSASVS